MGDPQAPFAKVLAVLDRHRALAGDRLAADVVLVSIGDHFDYDPRDPHTAGRDGVELLRWLASHDPAQVILLLGNHDAARVMELATISDADFAAARACEPADYAARYPALPPHGVLARDYASFSAEQRALVQALLLAGRFQLACSGELADGCPALLTHAAVTTADLGRLASAAAEPVAHEPRAIAAALDRHLVDRVDQIRVAWQRGELVPLSLEPLHRAGRDGEEGDGLLYHRPSRAGGKPRRFDPHDLAPGLTQIAGHTGHAKCVEELGDWCTDAARARKHGGIRTLVVEGSAIRYDLGVAPSVSGTRLVLVDGELRRLPADEVELLPLARVDR